MFHVLVRKNRTAHQRIDVRKRSTGGGFAFACGDKFDYGQTVIKIDKLNEVFIVDGEDLLADIRKNC